MGANQEVANSFFYKDFVFCLLYLCLSDFDALLSQRYILILNVTMTPSPLTTVTTRRLGGRHATARERDEGQTCQKADYLGKKKKSKAG